MGGQPLMKVTGVRKSYGPVEALRGVDLTLNAGETVALVGDNGAGKSTLVKILAGVTQPTSGELYYEGERISLVSADVARAHGIETVYQDLGLCANLSVAGNIFLGREITRRVGPFRFLDQRAMREAASKVLPMLSINAPAATANVAQLSGGQRQAVALARTTMWDSKLVLLDEPTAALGVQETERAMQSVRRLQEKGVALVIISHDLSLVMQMSERIVVLRHGEKVGDLRTADVGGDDVVALITGARERRIEAA